MSTPWQEIMAPLIQRVDREDESNAPFNIRVTTTLLVLAALFVGLRFLARHIKNISYGPEDWTCLLALSALLGCGALNYAMVANGLGRHVDTLSATELVTCLKCLLALECMYNVTMGVVKISFCYLYLRLFPMLKHRIWAIAGFVLALVVTFITVGLLQCTPMEKIWNPTVEGTCLHTTPIFVANAGLHFVTDMALLLLPLFQVVKLRVELVVKISLFSIFMLGAFVSIASMYRIKTILEVSSTDITFTFSNSNIWTMIEMSCSVISTCLPCLRPLVAKVSSAFATMSSPSGSRSRSSKALSVLFPNGFRRKTRTQTTHGERSTSTTTLQVYSVREDSRPIENSCINEYDHTDCHRCTTQDTTFVMENMPARKEDC